MRACVRACVRACFPLLLSWPHCNKDAPFNVQQTIRMEARLEPVVFLANEAIDTH